YLNTLQRAATDKYISMTHEKYKKNCGSRLGSSIEGIFTDEPHRGSVMTDFGNDNKNRKWMAPWTNELPATFKKQFGYDIVDRLPEVFLKKDGQTIAQVKWHYMEILEEMFLNNFVKPIYTWCDNNKMKLTGHFLHEDNLVAQAAMQGSLMRAYEYEHCPGVDVLTEGNRNYCIVKQVASVARQLGKKRLLSETYGCTGWQMTFENYKAVSNWQALFGINLRCHHLSWYTMEGEAKRDYPASIFFQSGWWKDYSKLEDYFSRLNVVLEQGKPECDLLVISPIESVWCQVGVGWANGLGAGTPEIGKIDDQYRDLYNWLLGARIDYDYGDEEMIGRLYRIDHDNAGHPVLWIGKASYKTVLVSGMTTIRRSTMKILEEFKKQGGSVIFAGDAPQYVDALKSSDPSTLSAQSVKVPFEEDAVVSACKKYIAPIVEVTDSKTGAPIQDVFCQVRNDKGTKYVVLMNMSTSIKYENVKVTIPGTGAVTEWNCLTAEQNAVNAENKGGNIEITSDFYPSGEHLYVVNSLNGKNTKSIENLKEGRKVSLSGPYEYKLSEKNICVLDIAKYKIDNEETAGETEILKIDQAVRDHYGLKLRGGEMIQPWFASKFTNNKVVKGTVKMNFEFNMADQPQDTVYLGMERPENFKISLNGKTLASKAKGWWADPSIQKVAIPASYFVSGKNDLELTVDFSEDKNLETLYLIGNFGVKLDGSVRTLTRLPEKIKVGNLTEQGLPFYTGNVTYKIPVTEKFAKNERLFFSVPEFEAACIKVHTPGNSTKMIAWQPYSVEVTKDLQKNNYLLVDFVLTRRNSFGPLHALPLHAGAYGPDNFVTGGDNFTMSYELYPSGLLAEPFISVRQ
ncbi:MAG: glycosyl hydrolase, partial [Bacteroidota bacterium]|nr:glycosyl hydrolase [Bacteroidota bacterium]